MHIATKENANFSTVVYYNGIELYKDFYTAVYMLSLFWEYMLLD